MITYAQAVDKLIAERRRRKLRQSDLENISGLGKGYISNLERGVKIASVPTFLRWCWALEVNPFCPHTEAIDGTEGTSRPVELRPEVSQPGPGRQRSGLGRDDQGEDQAGGRTGAGNAAHPHRLRRVG